MPNITILFGVLLSLLGVGSFFFAHTKSYTALIPAAIGLLLILCGLLAYKPSLRKFSMHGAVVISFLGFLSSFYPLRYLPKQILQGHFQPTYAQTSALLMSLLCVIYVGFSFSSFRSARRQPL